MARGRIEVVPEEADVIREAAARVLAGQSLAAIVVDVNERGIPSAVIRPDLRIMLSEPGRHFSPCGLRESKGGVVGEASWEPILDWATWEQVCPVSTMRPSVAGRRSSSSPGCAGAPSAAR